MKFNWFRKKDSDCVITLSKEDFRNGEFSLNLKLKDYKRTPQKGDLIKFDLGSKLINPDKQFANEYRILKLEGDMAYVVSMYELNRMEFGTSQRYNESDIDRFLEEGFYPSISEEGKKAITKRSIAQDSYTKDIYRYSSETYASTVDEFVKWSSYSQGYISLLSYIDILEYFEGIFSEQDVFRTFFKDKNYGFGHSFWLLSACAGYPNDCWAVGGYGGSVYRNLCSNTLGVRPAFSIDLSKIKYEFVDED